MEASRHLPGCDQRHTRRQRCSSQPSLPYLQHTVSDAVYHARKDGGIDTGAIPLLARSVSILCVLVAAFAGLVLVGRWYFVNRLYQDEEFARLPVYAYPLNARLSDQRVATCPESDDLCEELSFTSQESAPTTLGNLKASLEGQGWVIGDEMLDEGAGSFSLFAGSSVEEICVGFSGRAPHELPDDPGIRLIVQVFVEPC